MIETMKIIIIATFGLVFLIIAYKTRLVDSVLKRILFIFLELIITIILIFLSFWGVNMGLKKAIITDLSNSRILSTETIILTGYVRNVGKYTIDKAVLNVKVLSGVSGKAQEPGVNRDGSTKETTMEKSFVIAKNLRPGEQRRFRAATKYPPHFRLADVKTHLSWN